VPTEILVLVNGINWGLRFLLISLGFVVTLRVWNFFNIWHVGAVTIGGYIVYYFYYILKLNLGLSMLISIIGVVGIGLIIARYLYQPLRGSSLSLMVLSMGLAFVTNSALELLFGPTSVAYLSPVPRVSFLGSTLVEYIISAVALSALLFIWIFLTKTRRGKMIEAFSENPVLTSLRGINPQYIFLSTWMISLALAAVSGMLVGWVQPLLPTMGWRFIVAVFAVTILGRNSLRGILLSSLTIGIAMSFGVYLFIPEAYQFAIVFAILIMALVGRAKYGRIVRGLATILKLRAPSRRGDTEVKL
jgi:branched-chain amino acid transport system permease protein